ncbi:putative short-chain dehydrogenases/reductase [Aspergillus fijiensis CBS 313.89]|uniref:Putative short-chain dehydrogenases/reductase n=1 Tax=Aspergillus fijiensis CBS 313.89 TaxID=1448319 RepID=A0A8G1RJT8_9EURO|nr:putative short-chain dehydrogenases/reductase [Aspergillus fijiensis CBS 313.89]RAK75322.1 putative short-chain dehydrogenases/reductase [Aspergillus fijiensis CBS 313.89]
MSNLTFNCALITGGGGGLGKAIASYLLRKGKKVIIAGRTEQTLRQTAQEIGATDYFVLDTGVVSQIPAFIRTLTARYPEVDCLINNAGVQRPLDVLGDAPADFLAKADQEIDINIRGPMHLTLGLLEHFRALPHGRATIMNVSSILAFVPFSVINPVYNGTKAWLHFWSMTLRTQLEKGGYEGIRVVEVVPPSVGTDLHRDRSDPDDNKKHKNPKALTVEEFMEFFIRGLEGGQDVIAPGVSQEVVDKWYAQFGGMYDELAGEHKQ